MCFGSGGSSPPVQPAVAPPAPEATPEEVIPSEDSSALGNDKKNVKKKAAGLTTYKTDLSVPNATDTGVSIPV